MTQNQIAFKNAKELERHNKMAEQETNRHQLAQEALTARANYNTAVANYIQAAYNTEIARSNQARERLTRESNAISLAQTHETSRHNLAMENIQQSLNASTIKRNLAEVSVASANAGLIQERTKTQGWSTTRERNNVVNDLIQRGHTQADTKLKGAQTETESAKSFSSYGGGFSSVVNAIGTALSWL